MTIVWREQPGCSEHSAQWEGVSGPGRGCCQRGVIALCIVGPETESWPELVTEALDARGQQRGH